MNTKKYLLSLLFCLFLASIPEQTYPMAKRMAARAKMVLSAGLTLGHWALSAGPLWTSASEGAYELGKLHEKMDPVTSPEVKEFCRQQLAQNGVTNADTFPIVTGNRGSPYAAIGHHALFINWKEKRQLEKILSKNSYQNNADKQFDVFEKWTSKENKEELDAHAAIISHESSHINNQHGKKSIAFLYLTPLVTHVACQFLPFKIASFWLQQGMKLPAGILKGVVNLQLGFLHSRIQEQQADDEIRNDIELLKAACNNFGKMERKVNQEFLEVLKEKFKGDEKNKPLNLFQRWIAQKIQCLEALPVEEQNKKLVKFHYLLMPSHPPFRHRIERLEKRIEELLAQEEAKKENAN